MAHKYPELQLYLDELGESRIKALGHKEKSIKTEIRLRREHGRLCNEFARIFVGKTLGAEQIRLMMNDVYANLAPGKRVKVTNLSNTYHLTVVKHRVTTKNGSKEYVYEIK